MKKQNNAYVVDDDASARGGLTRLLIAAGYNVKAYASVGEFVKTFGPDIFGFIILDTRMPGMTGEELLTILEEHGINIPIIVVSGDDDANTRKKAKEMKAVGFFRKPVDGTALLDAIEWALKSGRTGKNHNKVEEG